jgi:hypothetical protein
VQRDRVVRIADDCDGDEPDLADTAARGIAIDPAGARHIDLRPGMGRPACRAARRLLRIVERDGEISGRKSRGETERARRLDHQHGEIAAAAMADPQRLNRLPDSLGFPPPIAQAMHDALRKPGEKLEGADRTARRQELTSPAANVIRRIGLMAFQARREVRYLVGAVGEGKGPCVVLEVEAGGARGRMIEAHHALDPQLF